MKKYLTTFIASLIFIAIHAQKPFILQRWGFNAMHLSYFSPIEIQNNIKMLPGVKLGAEYPIEYTKTMKEGKTNMTEIKFSAFQLSAIGNIGSYHHFGDHHAVFINGEFAVRFINVIVLEAKLGAGIMKRFYVNDVSVGFNETLGLMPLTSFGIGYNFPHNKNIPLGIYLRGSIFDLLNGNHPAFPAIGFGLTYFLEPTR